MARDDGLRIRPEKIARVVVRLLGNVLPLGFLVRRLGRACLVYGHRDGAARDRRRLTRRGAGR
jgi:hypothetical protein